MRHLFGRNRPREGAHRRVLSAAAFGILLLVLGQSAVPEDFGDGAELIRKMQSRNEQLFEFDKWREFERRPGCGLTELPHIHAVLANRYPRVETIRPRIATSRRLSLNVYPEEDRRTRVSVVVEVCESPLEAKTRLVNWLGASSLPDQALRARVAAPPMEMGDVAFASGAEQPSIVVFARNNVLVEVMVSIRDGDAKILEIAQDIDEVLTKHLRTTTFPLPEETASSADSGRSPESQELTKAVADKDVGILIGYARSKRPAESNAAIRALAKSVEGREALFKLVSDPETDRMRARVALAALGNVATADAIEFVREFAAATEDPRLYEAAFEAAAEGMPREQSREFCIAEVRRLADGLPASAKTLAAILPGLGPDLMRDGDPAETQILREIVAKVDDEDVREATVRVLSAWVTEGADMRAQIARVLAPHADDDNGRVRLYVVKAMGRSGNVEHLGTLLQLLDDPDESVRVAAVRSIAQVLGVKLRMISETAVVEQQIEQMRQAGTTVVQALQEARTLPEPKHQ